MKTIRSGSTYYQVNDKGEISGEFVRPSGSWLLVGAVTRNNLGAVTRWWTLEELLHTPPWLVIPWRFKNGKQRTFIRDLDHGSVREWRSPEHEII